MARLAVAATPLPVFTGGESAAGATGNATAGAAGSVAMGSAGSPLSACSALSAAFGLVMAPSLLLDADALAAVEPQLADFFGPLALRLIFGSRLADRVGVLKIN